MKLFQLSIWGFCAILSLALIYSWQQVEEKPFIGVADIGGEFSMMSARGVAVTENSFPDKAKLMFLGFTNCPDVCPTTLSEITGWLKELGNDADKYNPSSLRPTQSGIQPKFYGNMLAFSINVLSHCGHRKNS